MLKELNILGNRILEINLESSVIEELKKECLACFKNALEVSELYPSESNVYLFRTPSSLKNKQTGPGYQFQLNNSKHFDQYAELVQTELFKLFNKKLKINDRWVLLQTNESWIQNDIHQHLTADWVSVCYLSLNENDSIEFCDDGGNSEKYYPTPGTILIFDSSVKHKPNVNSGDLKRISINLELCYEEVEEKDIKMAEERYSTCKQCDRLNALNICKECMCFMPFKIKITNAQCPLNKWQL
jgi:hypothetical protein